MHEQYGAEDPTVMVELQAKLCDEKADKRKAKPLGRQAAKAERAAKAARLELTMPMAASSATGGLLRLTQ